MKGTIFMKRTIAVILSLILTLNATPVFGASFDLNAYDTSNDDIEQIEAENQLKNEEENDCIQTGSIEDEIETEELMDNEDIIDNEDITEDIVQSDYELSSEEKYTGFNDAVFDLGTAVCSDDANEYVSSIKGTSNEDAKVIYTAKYGQTEARRMLKMINDFRTTGKPWAYNENNEKVYYEGLKELKYDYELEKVAMQRAAEIALYYAHSRPDGNPCWQTYKDLDYSYQSAGENIAAGMNCMKKSEDVMEAWKEENEKYSGQGHRRNMLSSSFNAVGFGYVHFDDCEYWVQNFSYTNKNSDKTDANDGNMVVYVAINANGAKASGISLSETSLQADVSQSVKLPTTKADVNLYKRWPEQKTQKFSIKPNWTVNNPEIAKIEGDKITALAEGTTKVNANVINLTKDFTFIAGREKLIQNATIEGLEQSYKYTGEKIKPKLTLKFEDGILTENVDYSLEYYNNIKAGTASILIYGIGKFGGQKTLTFKIEALDLRPGEGKDKDLLKVSFEDAAENGGVYYYKGTAIKPMLSVSVNGIVLEEGSDYKLSYKNNVKPGDGETDKSPYVVINGLGSYSSLKNYRQYFSIKRVNLATEAYYDEVYGFYNGKKQNIVPTLYIGNIKLKNKKDFKVEGYYKDGVLINPVDVGSYTIKVSGIGGYEGILNIPLIISDAKMPLSKLKITVKKADFDSNAAKSADGIQTNVSVKNGKTELVEGVDYTLKYKSNHQCGTALVSICAKEDSDYVGWVTCQYKIVGIKMNKVKVKGMVSKILYNNTKIVQNFICSNRPDYTYLTYTDKNRNEINLKYAEDYYVKYYYPAKENAGKVTMIITGNPENGYEGSIKKIFTIDKVAFNSERISVDNIADVKYTGNKVYPPLTIYYTPEDGAEKIRLVYGEDYTCSYKNNKDTALSTDGKKAPSVTIKGKGNYKGSKVVYFSIKE